MVLDIFSFIQNFLQEMSLSCLHKKDREGEREREKERKRERERILSTDFDKN